VGVSVETLRAALRGKPVSERDRLRIERWLYSPPPPPDEGEDHIDIREDREHPPEPRRGRAR
jgi:hypothetical protein